MPVAWRHNSPRCMELSFESHPANLAVVRRAVEPFAEACGFDPTLRGQIILCVNEALANIIRHAYSGATDRPIVLTVECVDEAIRVSIRDWGSGVEPPGCAAGGLRAPQEEHDPLKAGGLGLVCMRQWMDEVVFIPQADGMLLTMVRRKSDRPVKRAG